MCEGFYFFYCKKDCSYSMFSDAFQAYYCKLYDHILSNGLGGLIKKCNECKGIK